jgi:putative FmdB family regulatory protein
MTYEYLCAACGHQWEAEQSIKDAALKKCVACGKSTAKRLVSGGTGFLLKGGGWYADGYGSKSAPSASAASGESPAAKSTGEAAGASGDSATKSDGPAKSSTSSESAPSKPAEASPKASSAPSTPSAKAS